MTEPVGVWLAEDELIEVGTLFPHRRRRAESATFAYSGNYLKAPAAYAVDPALPLSASAHHTPAHAALFGAFTDAAPDRGPCYGSVRSIETLHASSMRWRSDKYTPNNKVNGAVAGSR